MVAPVFAPLGFGDWRICTALVAGFIAKESVVSSLSVLSGGNVFGILNPISAWALLVFCLLYTPCVAAVAAVKRELGGKWATIIAFGQCFIAWIVAFAVKIII